LTKAVDLPAFSEIITKIISDLEGTLQGLFEVVNLYALICKHLDIPVRSDRDMEFDSTIHAENDGC
jgi:hypothetical protein